MMTNLRTFRPGNSAATTGGQSHKEPLVYEYVEMKQRSYK